MSSIRPTGIGAACALALALLAPRTMAQGIDPVATAA